MDETPIQAGTTGKGEMNAAYFWPVYGERDEICFAFQLGRSDNNMKHALGVNRPHGSVLVTDEYDVYARYAMKIGRTHAQCWAHIRRYFCESDDAEPAARRRGGNDRRTPNLSSISRGLPAEDSVDP